MEREKLPSGVSPSSGSPSGASPSSVSMDQEVEVLLRVPSPVRPVPSWAITLAAAPRVLSSDAVNPEHFMLVLDSLDLRFEPEVKSVLDELESLELFESIVLGYMRSDLEVRTSVQEFRRSELEVKIPESILGVRFLSIFGASTSSSS